MPLSCAGMKGFMCQNSGRTTLRIGIRRADPRGPSEPGVGRTAQGFEPGTARKHRGDHSIQTAREGQADSSGNLITLFAGPALPVSRRCCGWRRGLKSRELMRSNGPSGYADLEAG
jgi:hypothetical protein